MLIFLKTCHTFGHKPLEISANRECLRSDKFGNRMVDVIHIFIGLWALTEEPKDMGIHVNARHFPFPQETNAYIYTTKAIAKGRGNPFQQLIYKRILIVEGVYTSNRDRRYVMGRAYRIKQAYDMLLLLLRREFCAAPVMHRPLHSRITLCKIVKNGPIHFISQVQGRRNKVSISGPRGREYNRRSVFMDEPLGV